MAIAQVAPQATEWDASGNPVTTPTPNPATPGSNAVASTVTEWDANGNPVASHAGQIQDSNGNLVTRPNDYLSKTEDALGAAAQHPVDTLRGIGSELLGMAKSAATQVFPGQHELVQSVESIPPIYRAYEQARRQGKSVWEAAAAANNEAKRQADARDMLKQRVKELTDTSDPVKAQAIGKSITDLVVAATGLAAGANGEGAETAEVSPAEPAPEVPAEPTTTPEPVAEPTAATPVDTQVTKATSASGLPEGTPETVAPDESSVQGPLQQGVKDTFAKLAKDSGVDASEEGSLTRDSASDVASQIKARSSSAYQALDDASGGRWQRFNDKIGNLQDKADELAGVDDEKADQFQNQADELTRSRDALVNQLVKDGKIDTDTATKASADWKQSQALYDVDKAIKSTVRPPTSANPETVTSVKTLEGRLQRLKDSGRLDEAMPGHADELLSHVQNANDALTQIKEFVPQTATGQQMLKQIIARNTTGKSSLLRGGKITGSTDWSGAVKDFENLGASAQRAAFGESTPLVRQYLGRQALKQNALKLLRVGVGLGTAEEMARRGINVLVKAEPAGSDTGTTVAPEEAPDVAMGSSTKSNLGSILTGKQPVMPRLAGPRDYLDSAADQSTIGQLYNDAQATFNPYSKMKEEHLIAVGNDGGVMLNHVAAPGETRSAKAAIPNDATYIAHTHPSTATAVPSPEDYRTATKLGKPNFVISKNAIYVAMPGTDPKTDRHVKVADISPGKGGKLNVKWN